MRHLFLVLPSAALVLACSDPSAPLPPPPGAADRALVASKVVMLGIGVATAPEGGGPFDNVLPCPRRGLVTYYNSPAGRAAIFHACDAGDGVVVSGTVDVRWPNPRSATANIPSVAVVGDLRVTVGSGPESSVTDVSATGIAFTGQQGVRPSPRLLDPSGASISAFGETITFLASASADNVFFPTLTIDAIPNPLGMEGLAENDVRRLALHGGMYLGRVLLNETLESSRGEHTHTLPCGTLHIVPDGQLVRMEAVWNACDAGFGLFISGTFTARWASFSESDMRMVVTGQVSFGGGVPQVSLSGMEWNLSGFTAGVDLYELTIGGALISGSTRRAYSFKYLVDD